MTRESSVSAVKVKILFVGFVYLAFGATCSLIRPQYPTHNVKPRPLPPSQHSDDLPRGAPGPHRLLPLLLPAQAARPRTLQHRAGLQVAMGLQKPASLALAFLCHPDGHLHPHWQSRLCSPAYLPLQPPRWPPCSPRHLHHAPGLHPDQPPSCPGPAFPSCHGNTCNAS